MNLDAKLAHMGVSRSMHSGTHRERQVRPVFFQHSDGSVDLDLLGFRQPVPPVLKFVSELDLPGHNDIIPFRDYAVKRLSIGQIRGSWTCSGATRHRAVPAEVASEAKHTPSDVLS
jgi:hypothetical protein